MQRILGLFCLFLGCFPLCAQDHHQILLDYYDGRITLPQDSARMIASSVLSEPKSTYFETLANYLLGYNQDIGNDKIAALLSYLSALEGISEVDTTDLYLEINLRKSLGFLLHEYQHYDYALAFYEKAMPFAERYDDKELASLWYNKGFAYRKLDSVDQALHCFDMSLQLSEGNLRKQLQVFNQRGLLEQQQDQWQNAASFYQKMIEKQADITTSLRRYLWMAYHNLGNVYLKQERYDSAIITLNTALTFADQTKAFISHKDLGEAHHLSGHSEQSERAWHEAELLYDHVSLHPDHFDVFKLIALSLPEMDKNRWDYYLRYTHELERYQQQSDEIKELAARGYVGSLISHYLDEVAEAKEREAQLWKIGMFIAGMIAMFLVLLALQWWRKRQLKEQMGNLTGTMKDVETTLKHAIEATK